MKTITPSERLQLIGLGAIIQRRNAAVRTVEHIAEEILGPESSTMDHFNTALWDPVLGPEEAIDLALEHAGVTVTSA